MAVVQDQSEFCSKFLEYLPIGVRQSVEFIINASGTCRGSLLDVGCGNGAISKALKDLDFTVTSIDSSHKAKELSLRNNVEVITVDLIDYQPNCKFDVLFFGRSMHHFDKLHAYVSKSRSMLNPHGVILIEDFAHEDVNDSTADWLKDIIVTIQALSGENYRAILEKTGLEMWRDIHSHEIIPFTNISTEISSVFQISNLRSCEYIFRYIPLLCKNLSSIDCLMHAIYFLEKNAIYQGRVKAIGRRLIGHIK